MNFHHSPNKFSIVASTFLVVATSCVFMGCNSSESWNEPGPRATFETFLMNVFRGQDEAAFASIAPEDRQALTAALDELDELPEEARPKPHEMWVITAVDNPYDVKRIEVEGDLESEPKKGQRVTLNISYQDGRAGNAVMVWGGDAWFVDLPLENVAAKSSDKG